MAFNLRSGAVPDGSITTNKLADDAVTTAKIATDAVTVDKAERAIVTEQFFGTEASLTHTGTTEITIGEFNFDKAAPHADWKALTAHAKLQSSDIGNNATLNIYIGGVQYATFTTASTTPVVFEDDSIDISAVPLGNNLVEFKLVNSTALGIATATLIEIFFAKK